MDEKMEKVQKLSVESGVQLKKFVESNPPRAFYGGKIKYREYQRIVELLTTNIDEVEKNVGIKSSCTKGCTACCTHPILVDGFDVDMIMNYLERNYDRDAIRKVKDRVHEAAGILDKEFGSAPKNESELSNIIRQEHYYKSKYFELKLKCPLISEENSCMVYPVRPSPCWSYRAYGNPQECETTHDIPDTFVYVGHENYFAQMRQLSYESKTIPRSRSYQLSGFLPQKLRDAF